MDKTPRELLVEKLLSDSTVTHTDIAALGMYNNRYIKLLMRLSQEQLKQKLAEMIVTPSISEFKSECGPYA